MLVLILRLPGGATLPCILTFVPKAAVTISAFCGSCALIRPEEGADVERTPVDCLGRYLYVTVVNDSGDVDSDPMAGVARFMTREVALIKNPQLAQDFVEGANTAPVNSSQVLSSFYEQTRYNHQPNTRLRRRY
jgi:hypothetical protein